MASQNKTNAATANNKNNNNNGRVVTSENVEDPLNVFRFENDWNTPVFGCCDDCKLSKMLIFFSESIWFKLNDDCIVF
jgi:hypothetical protein